MNIFRGGNDTFLKASLLISKICKLHTFWGSLKRSVRAVQLFGRLAVLETNTLRY